MTIFFWALPVSASTVLTLREAEWKRGNPQLILDIDSNTGYLLYEDASYFPFLIASGQRRFVHYLGYAYFAATPLGSWSINDEKIQPDKMTFGPTGRFFRLYEDGSKHTYYGIHSHKYVAKWLAQGERYKSYGCVIVSDEVLDILEKALDRNGSITAITTFGSQKFLDEIAERERVKTNF